MGGQQAFRVRREGCQLAKKHNLISLSFYLDYYYFLLFFFIYIYIYKHRKAARRGTSQLAREDDSLEVDTPEQQL